MNKNGVCRLKHNKEESMKKMLLIAGIIFIIAGVLSLLYAALNLFGYYHVLDGSADLYRNLHRRMITFGLSGIVLAVLGTVCLIIRLKNKG
jgi:uncharacterized membrane protein HdeD (DUF308 family)